MRISVIGLGYVGAVSAGCLVNDGHVVIGCDIDRTKLDLILSGRTPIIERRMQDLIANAVNSGRLQPTDDIGHAVHNTQLSFICVGTPSLPNGGQNLTAIRRTSEQLGQAMKSKHDFHLFVVRSTVLPSTVEGVVQPILEKHSGKNAGTDFGLCFQPEFLREGSSVWDYYHPPYTVVGVDTDRSAEMLREIFGHLPGEFVVTDVRTAEMLKYSCNAFHALKTAFANEVGRIAQALGVDSHAVMELLCKDRQLNISSAYLKPGFAFGGSCLPKDVKALLHVAKRKDVEIPMLSGILPSNTIHINHAIDIVLSTGMKSVGMIGLSFKDGTDDLRESPLVAMAERLIGKGLELKIYDPLVNVARLIGANRRYIEESIPHISSLMKPSCEEVIQNSDLLIVGLRDEPLMQSIYEHSRDDHIVVDLVNIPDRTRVRGTYYGICW